MLHYSKFVNTKAYEKANPKNTSPFPVFTKPVVSSSRVRRPAVVPEKYPESPEAMPEEQVPAEAEALDIAEPELKPFMHPSVNLEEMQKKEDLSMQEEDWLSFFMGKTNAASSPWAEDPVPEEHVASFADEYGPPPLHELIVPAAPQEETGIMCFQEPVKTEEEEEAQAPGEISWMEAAMEAARQIEGLKACEEREMAEAALKRSLDALMLDTMLLATAQQASAPLPAPPLPAAAELPSPVAALPAIDPMRSPTGPDSLNMIFDELIADDKVFKRECKI